MSNSNSNNILQPINTITLSDTDYGAALNDRLSKIQGNFNAIIQSEYLKGAPGNNTVTKSVILTNSNPNDGIGVYLNTNSENELTLGDLFEYIEDAIKTKWGIESSTESSTSPLSDIEITNESGTETEAITWDQDLSDKEIILITEQVSDRLILKSIVPFTHIDLRFYNPNISENSSDYVNLIDTSCSIHYDTENGFVALSSFPTLYYDPNVGEGDICWKINGQETGMVAKGPAGKDAIPFISYLCKGILNGENIEIIAKWDLNINGEYIWQENIGEGDLPEGSQCFVIVENPQNSGKYDLYIIYPTWDAALGYFKGTKNIGIQNNWSDYQFEQCMLHLGQSGAASGLIIPTTPGLSTNTHLISNENDQNSNTLVMKYDSEEYDSKINIEYNTIKLGKNSANSSDCVVEINGDGVTINGNVEVVSGVDDSSGILTSKELRSEKISIQPKSNQSSDSTEEEPDCGTIQNIQLNNSKLSQTIIDNSTIENSTVIKGSLESPEILTPEIINPSIEGGAMENASLDNCAMENVSLNNSVIEGDTTVNIISNENFKVSVLDETIDNTIRALFDEQEIQTIEGRSFIFTNWNRLDKSYLMRNNISSFRSWYNKSDDSHYDETLSAPSAYKNETINLSIRNYKLCGYQSNKPFGYIYWPVCIKMGKRSGQTSTPEWNIGLSVTMELLINNAIVEEKTKTFSGNLTYILKDTQTYGHGNAPWYFTRIYMDISGFELPELTENSKNIKIKITINNCKFHAKSGSNTRYTIEAYAVGPLCHTLDMLTEIGDHTASVTTDTTDGYLSMYYKNMGLNAKNIVSENSDLLDFMGDRSKSKEKINTTNAIFNFERVISPNTFSICKDGILIGNGSYGYKIYQNPANKIEWLAGTYTNDSGLGLQPGFEIQQGVKTIPINEVLSLNLSNNNDAISSTVDAKLSTFESNLDGMIATKTSAAVNETVNGLNLESTINSNIDAKLSTFESNLDGIVETKVSEVASSEISSLKVTNATLSTRIDALEGTKSTLSTRIDALEGTKSTLENNIKNIENSLNSEKENIRTELDAKLESLDIGKKITSLGINIEDLQSSNQGITKQDIQDLKNAKTLLENRINELEDNNIEFKTQTNNNIKNIENSLNSEKENIRAKLAAELESLDIGKKITDLGINIEDLKSINSLKADIDTAKANIDTAKANIDTAIQKVNDISDSEEWDDEWLNKLATKINNRISISFDSLPDKVKESVTTVAQNAAAETLNNAENIITKLETLETNLTTNAGDIDWLNKLTEYVSTKLSAELDDDSTTNKFAIALNRKYAIAITPGTTGSESADTGVDGVE